MAKPQKPVSQKTAPSDSSAVSVRKSHMLWLLLIIAVAYLRVVPNGFITDDIALLTERQPLLKSTNGLSELVSHGYWYGSPQAETRALYRPWISATYWLEYQIGGLSPTIYHLSNVAVHSANALLIVPLFAPIISATSALLLAALFGVTPAALISVGWISGRTDLWLTFFSLLFCFHVRAALRTGHAMRIFLAAASYFMAVMSKESGLLVPLFAGLLWWIENSREKNPISLRGAWKLWIALAAVALVSLYIRGQAVGDSVFAAGGFSALGQTIAHLPEQLFRHCGQALIPLHSQMFSDLWSTNAQYNSVIFYSLWALFLIAGAAAIRGFVKREIWAVGLLWMSLILAPIYLLGQAWMPVTYFYNYFALIGIYLFAIDGGQRLAIRFRMDSMISMAVRQRVLIALVVLFALITFARAPILHDTISLYSYMEKREPKNTEVLMALGGFYLSESKTNEGLERFARAAKINPANSDPYRRLLDWHVTNGDITSAARLVPDVERTGLGNPASQAMLGRYYYESNACSTAYQCYQKSFALQLPTDQTLYDFGLVLICLNRFAEGRDLYVKLTAKNPSWANATNNLGICYESLNDLEHAADAYQQTIRINPNLLMPLASLAFVYQRSGKNQAANSAAAEFLRKATPSPQTERIVRQFSEAGIVLPK